MGKSKQAQRTKNNARPSNSSRAAELLGTSMCGFVGFSAVRDGGYVPTLPGLSLYNNSETEMTAVDSNFQIVLKKMYKKDSTTRSKALHEFATMCHEAELSSVEGMLSFWPRSYCTLAIDGEHRVREAAQLAHAAVVERVGKRIAMYLKQVAGAWFTSQYDTYPPAASAAQNSFNATFPPKKIVDAIVYCQREILTYICENITIQTPQTLSEQKSLSAEEMEAKYQKVVVSNLRAYSSYLKKVPRQEIEKMVELHQKIITNNKFWKLVKHQSFPIKTAFFNALTAVLEHADILLKDEKKRAVTTIMNSLDETDPSLLAAVWESMLLAITKIEDWYCVVSIEKLVLPKLWRVLRSGGQCCACTVYPNLLPFISQFPKLNVDPNTLYTNFFSNMRQGFSAKSVQISRAETFAVVTSFTECLRYSILLNVKNQSLCTSLLKEQLIPVLEGCLKENSPIKNVLFCEIAHLIRYWSRNRNNEEYKSYSLLMEEFWKELNILYTSLIDGSQNCETFNTPDPNNSQIEFLLTLKNAPVHTRKNLKVKFAEEEENDKNELQTKNTNTEADAVFIGELNDIVNSLCITYFNKITEQRSKKYIIHLNKLVTSFEDAEFFVVLSKSLRTKINFFNIYNEILRDWLLEISEHTEHIVKFIFNIIKYMSEAEKSEILKLLTELDDVAINRNVVQCSMSKANRNDNLLRQWCSKSQVTKLLIDVANEIVSGASEDLEKNQNLILLAFETFDDGDFLIEDDGVHQIISILSNSLHNVDESQLPSFAKLITRIVPLTWTQPRLKRTAIEVLEVLFQLCIHEYFVENTNYMESMVDVWKNGVMEAVRNLSQSEFITLTEKLANVIWNKIYEQHDVNEQDNLTSIAGDFVRVIINEELDLETDYIKEIILTFLMESGVKSWMIEATNIILYGEAITGKLYISSEDQKMQIHEKIVLTNVANNVEADNTEKCLIWALFTTTLLNNLSVRSSNDDNCESEETETIDATDEVLSLTGMSDILMSIIYSIILGETYDNYYKSTQHYSNVKKCLRFTQNKFSELQKQFDDDTYRDIINYISTNYARYNCMLPYILKFCCTKLQSNINYIDLLQIYKNSEDIVTNRQMQLQGIQMLMDYVEPKNIFVLQEDDISQLILTRCMLSRHQDVSFDILDQIIHTYYDAVSDKEEDPEHLLLNCDISNTSWSKIVFPLEIIRLLTELVNRVPAKLTSEQWDYVMLSVVLWQGTINKSKHNASDFKISALTIAICQLYTAIESLMQKYEQKESSDISDTLYGSWKNVLAAEVQCGIVQTWMRYADLYNEKQTTPKPVIILDSLGTAICHLDKAPLFKEKTNVSPMSLNLDDTVNSALQFLQSPVTSIQLGAYHVLKHIIPELVKSDKTLIESENFDSNSLSIRRIEAVLRSTQNIVNTIFMEFKLCDTVSCAVQPYTDSYTYTLGYLLTWAVILEMCANAHGDLRYQYAEVLKDEFLPSLLNNIFRLMPVELLQDNKNKSNKLVEVFTTVPSLKFGESWTEWRLDHIVCWLYANSLRHLPALVRQWWSTADSRVSAAVDKITTHYVSPMLCQEELLNIKAVNIGNMQIKVHPTAREVIALYLMDDTKLELSVVLPPNHPLGPVTVEPGQHAGGAANWRNCHMQLSILLTHQNGSVWDGLTLWKRNLDKKFAGVEECYICFSIFDINTYQIPKLSCRTCRKKFHTPCLYKWFNTSQNSTCPICRNVF